MSLLFVNACFKDHYFKFWINSFHVTHIHGETIRCDLTIFINNVLQLLITVYNIWLSSKMSEDMQYQQVT